MGKEDNPTFYRKPIDYQQMMNFVRNADKKEEEWFKTIQSKSLSSYIRVSSSSKVQNSLIENPALNGEIIHDSKISDCDAYMLWYVWLCELYIV